MQWTMWWDHIMAVMPWIVFTLAEVGLFAIIVFVTHRATQAWDKRHIRDNLGEIAKAEIKTRDVQIRELVKANDLCTRENNDLKGIIRGAHSVLSGVIFERKAQIRAIKREAK